MSEEISIEKQVENFLDAFNKKFDGHAKKQNLHDMIVNQLDNKIFHFVREYFINIEPVDMVKMLRVLSGMIEAEDRAELKRLEDIKMADPAYRKKMKKLKKAVDAVKEANAEEVKA